MITNLLSKLTSLKQRISATTYISDMLSTRMTLSLGSILWGILLLFSETSTNFMMMERFAPLLVWAGLFIMQGCYSMHNILYPEKIKRFSIVLDAGLGCGLWTLSCFSLLVGHAFHPSLAAEIALSFASWVNLVKFNNKRPGQ